ncbi:MAG: hypothetical protein HYX47_23300 [Burkholderiales bacterium]|nr:hypothetical protein [Burkholderiales bacterium]
MAESTTEQSGRSERRGNFIGQRGQQQPQLQADPHVLKSAALLDYQFSKQFTPDSIGDLRSKTERGLGVMKDDFGKMLDQAELTSKSIASRENNTKMKTGMFDKEHVADSVEVGRQVEKLLAQAKEWRGQFDENGKRKQTGNLSNRTEEADEKRMEKIKACEQIIAGAELTKAQMSGGLDNLKALKAQQEKDPHNAQLNADLRLEDARTLREKFGMKALSGGTSAVGGITVPNPQTGKNEVAFVFKSIQGETDQTGLAKGGGALREVMSSAICNEFKYGPGKLDTGWPQTTLTEIKDLAGVPQKGALIDGIKGREVYRDGDNHKEAKDRFNSLKPEDIQLNEFVNLAMSQFDIKWGNVMQEEGTGKLRPFDGGAAFPTDNLFAGYGLATEGQAKGMNLLEFKGDEHAAAKLPISDDLKKRFGKISLEGMEAASQAVIAEARKAGMSEENIKGLEQGMVLAKESVKGMQTILGNNPDIKLGDFLRECEKDIYTPQLDKRKDQFMESQREIYKGICDKHPGCFQPPEMFTAKQIYENFTSPDQIQAFQRLEKGLAPDSSKNLKEELKKCSVATPIAAESFFKGVASKVTNNANVPEEVKAIVRSPEAQAQHLELQTSHTQKRGGRGV